MEKWGIQGILQQDNNLKVMRSPETGKGDSGNPPARQQLTAAKN